MRARLSKLWWGLLRGLYHSQWVLLAIGAYFALTALWTTFDHVQASAPRGLAGDCGSPWDPVDTSLAPEPEFDEDDAYRFYCDARLDDVRTERSRDMVSAAVPWGLVLLSYVAGARDWSRMHRPARAPVLTLPEIDEIESERLLIRRARPADLMAFQRTIDVEVIGVQGWTPLHVATLGYHVATDQPQWGTEHEYLAQLRHDDSTVGVISVAATESGPSLGWWVARDARRQGYASEMVRAVSGALFDVGMPFVQFATAEQNVVVQRIAEHLGAVEVDRGPFTLPDGRVDPAIHYRLNRPEES